VEEDISYYVIYVVVQQLAVTSYPRKSLDEMISLDKANRNPEVSAEPLFKYYISLKPDTHTYTVYVYIGRVIIKVLKYLNVAKLFKASWKMLRLPN